MRKTRLQIGFLEALVCFSAYIAITSYPAGAWWFGAAFGTMAFVLIFIRNGWCASFAIAGVYAGLFYDAHPKSGDIESQMQETIVSTVLGTFCGFLIGLLLDASTSANDSEDSKDKAVDD